MNVPALTHPEQSGGQSADSCSQTGQKIFEGGLHERDDEPGWEVESIGDGGEGNLRFYFEFATGSVDGGADKGYVGDCDVGGTDGCEVGLLVDESQHRVEGVRGCKKNEEYGAEF